MSEGIFQRAFSLVSRGTLRGLFQRAFSEGFLVFHVKQAPQRAFSEVFFRGLFSVPRETSFLEGFFRGLFQRVAGGLGEREGGGEVGTRPSAYIIKIHPCNPRGGGGNPFICSFILRFCSVSSPYLF